MPQPPSPLMGIIWPSDHGDDDAWDVLMDTAVRVTIDGHNHAAGSGAKVNISSLAYDADISFIDAGGGKHAITNMKAISFFPSPPSAMTGFSGAFFVSDGTGGTVLNELYFRTPLGTNVQFTDAGTLNVGAFAGTIGGDYVGAGALESFVDSADAYLFQQQVGAGVRQFAKMQCADLELFEFKAVGVTPVPGNNITLKVPAGLANTFSLTLPGALPAATKLVSLDAAGNVIAGATTTLQLPFRFGSAAATGIWSNSIAGGEGVPVPLPNGVTISAVRGRLKDSAVGPTKFTISLKTSIDGVIANVATSAQSAGTGVAQTLPINGLASAVSSGTNYLVQFDLVSGATVGTGYWVEVDYA